MKVILTGSSGFLGNIILHYLSNQNAEIFSIGRRNTNNLVCDFSTNIPIINEKNIDLVVHAAGKAHTFPKQKSQELEFYQVNVNGTSNLLEGINKLNLPKFCVFISSVSVYGKEFGTDIDESYPLAASDAYGLSKIKAEQIVQDWCTKYNVVCTILRLPLLIGPNPPGNLGSMLKGIKKGYYFNISGGNAKRSMVLAEDVAKVIPMVAEIGGIYNLTDGYHPSFSEFSNLISIQIGKRKPMNIPMWLALIIAKFGDLLGDKLPLNTNKLKKLTSDLTFDDIKARNTFGWNPTSVLDGVKQILAEL
jgi:nucleoside-diphosphate-sugar epimerase